MNKTNELRYLLITPLSEEFRSLRQLIADALREVGIEPILLEKDIKVGDFIVSNVQQAIEQADVIIADLTGSNPNVMYEVGLAHALRKPVLPIVQHRADHIPSDMAGYLFLVYDLSKLEQLRRNIKNWTVRLLANQGNRRHRDESLQSAARQSCGLVATGDTRRNPKSEIVLRNGSLKNQ